MIWIPGCDSKLKGIISKGNICVQWVVCFGDFVTLGEEEKIYDVYFKLKRSPYIALNLPNIGRHCPTYGLSWLCFSLRKDVFDQESGEAEKNEEIIRGSGQTCKTGCTLNALSFIAFSLPFQHAGLGFQEWWSRSSSAMRAAVRFHLWVDKFWPWVVKGVCWC